MTHTRTACVEAIGGCARPRKLLPLVLPAWTKGGNHG